MPYQNELCQVLVSSGKCKDEPSAIKKIGQLRARVRKGADPEKLLHNLGLEPDYILDLY
jgi:hypothetical protein